jgi:hypothetical protein
MPPRIVTARSMGLQFRVNQLVTMGPETSVVGHYSGGARARSMNEGIARAKSFHAHHLGQGWAGIGYHYVISDDGTIICCRSTFHQGAHVHGRNKGRIGVNMPGTLTPTIRDKPTRKQARAFNWLLHNAHTAAMPRAHRTDFDLTTVPLTVHKQLMATDCPGLFTGMYMRGGDRWVESLGGGPAIAAEGDEFVDLTPDDEPILADAERGALAGPEADGAATGPDPEELEAAGETEEVLELPEPDDDFDEDLAALVAEVEEEQRQPQS